MVSKWSSEDVSKFLDVYEESEGFGISDIPITTIKLNAIVQCVTVRVGS
jgi:hypothetical protein